MDHCLDLTSLNQFTGNKMIERKIKLKNNPTLGTKTLDLRTRLMSVQGLTIGIHPKIYFPR